jgi:hypothetical protein
MPMIVLDQTDVLPQVELILHSDAFRGSEVLRRLLKFLADKYIAGEADQLKEYTVAIDGLGKPPSYDPRHDSTVRIQVGRLRQKLAEYYRTEGKDDPIIVDLPKGHFKLTCESRPPKADAVPSPLTVESKVGKSLAVTALLMWMALFSALAWGVYSTEQLRRTQIKNQSSSGTMTADLKELWEPYIDTNAPIVVAIKDPLFLELKHGRGVYYRDKSLNDWDEILASSSVSDIRKALKNPDIQPSRYYTAFGEVNASFLIEKLLGERGQKLSLVRTSELTWQQLADNNVLFVGGHVFIDSRFHGMPIQPELVPISTGIQDLHPGASQPSVFLDHFATAPSEEGTVYALVSHLPGPLGKNDIEFFTSNRAAGYVAAVQWFTDPASAQALVAELKKPTGKFPRYYQVLLEVKFKDEVPVQTTYVTSRELR